MSRSCFWKNRSQLMTCGSKGIGMRADRPQIQTTTLRRVSKSVETGRCLSEFLFAGVPSSRRPRFPAWPGGKRGSSESSVSHWVRARGSFGGLSTGDHPSKPFPMCRGRAIAMQISSVRVGQSRSHASCGNCFSPAPMRESARFRFGAFMPGFLTYFCCFRSRLDLNELRQYAV